MRNIKVTALGLSIVNDLVNKMGEKVSFSSKENQGTTFKVVFPYEKRRIED